MTDRGKERIFISYSTEDGKEAADILREKFLAAGLSIWQDIITLRTGSDWWSQIEEALRSPSLQHFVLVVTPGALASSYVRQEIRLARQEACQVSPVLGPGIAQPEDLPRWLGQICDLNLLEHEQNLLATLSGPSEQPRAPMMAPEPPVEFIQRPKEFGALKSQLLDEKQDAVAITAALKGAGGYGKTTLAKALAHDLDIMEAFFGGILWIELGEKGENLLGKVVDLIEALIGQRPGSETPHAAGAALADALGDRRILLVIDDAWRKSDLEPLMKGGPSTTRLITTRDNTIIPPRSQQVDVDALDEAEAFDLISWNIEAAEAYRIKLRALSARLGEWPLLIKLVNGVLRNRITDLGQEAGRAITAVNRRLERKGFVAFDQTIAEARDQAVARTIDVSLDTLSATEQDRYLELAVFPEDADIPVSVCAAFWASRANWDEDDAEDLLLKLRNRSLLLQLDLERSTFRLHDTFRQYLLNQLLEEMPKLLHAELLSAIEQIDQIDSVGKRYYYIYRLDHLSQADDIKTLSALLVNPDWLLTKHKAVGIQPVLSDYRRYAQSPEAIQVGHALRLAADAVSRDPRQLAAQIWGRSRTWAFPCFAANLKALVGAGTAEDLMHRFPQLTPSGAESERLEGHSGTVAQLAVLYDGRLASGSDDNTIRIWDVTGQTETVSIEGHGESVTQLVILPDGRLVSGSHDNTIRVWDVMGQTRSVILEGHARPVTHLAVLPDGRLASASRDRTIRIWDVMERTETIRLEGHTDWVTQLAVLPDGRLASGSYDNTIRIWDVTGKTETIILEGHLNWVARLAVLSDGRLASGSYDNTIRIWDVTGQGGSVSLEGHADSVTQLAILPDGRVASGSYDNIIRIWDVTGQSETLDLIGHTEPVTQLAVLSDDRLASGSSDNTIRIWDVTRQRGTVNLELEARVSALVECERGVIAAGDALGRVHILELC